MFLFVRFQLCISTKRDRQLNIAQSVEHKNLIQCAIKKVNVRNTSQSKTSETRAHIIELFSMKARSMQLSEKCYFDGEQQHKRRGVVLVIEIFHFILSLCINFWAKEKKNHSHSVPIRLGSIPELLSLVAASCSCQSCHSSAKKQQIWGCAGRLANIQCQCLWVLRIVHFSLF